MVKRFATLARRSVDKFLGSIRVRFPNVPAADVRKKARICDTVLQAQVEASTSPDRYITLEQRYTTIINTNPGVENQQAATDQVGMYFSCFVAEPLRRDSCDRITGAFAGIVDKVEAGKRAKVVGGVAADYNSTVEYIVQNPDKVYFNGIPGVDIGGEDAQRLPKTNTTLRKGEDD